MLMSLFLGIKDEFRLQMEAQRLSLTQIHAAQLELLQEESDACTRSLELELQHRRDQSDQGKADPWF